MKAANIFTVNVQYRLMKGEKTAEFCHPFYLEDRASRRQQFIAEVDDQVLEWTHASTWVRAQPAHTSQLEAKRDIYSFQALLLPAEGESYQAR